MPGERGAKKRPNDDNMKATPKRVREDNYPKDGAPPSAYPPYDTTRDMEAQNVAQDASLVPAPVNATQAHQPRQRAEVHRSRAAQRYSQPPPNQFASAVPSFGGDQVARSIAGLNPGYSLYAPGFGLNAGNGNNWNELYQPPPGTSALAGQAYYPAQPGLEGQEQWRSDVSAFTGTATPMSYQLRRPMRHMQAGGRSAQYPGYSIAGPPPQPPMTPVPGYNRSINSQTSSPNSVLSMDSLAEYRPATPGMGDPPMHRQPYHVGQERPIPEDGSEAAKDQKARSDRIDQNQQEYDANKSAINHWWMTQQKSSKAPWYEKLMTWKQATGARPVAKPRSRTKVSSLAPATPLQTATMETAAEIRRIREQWDGLKPDRCRHSSDKVDIANLGYPAEDSLDNSTKRANGMYNCLHKSANKKCCKEGLSSKDKQRSIDKQIRNFKFKVQESILKKELHVAHKTWDKWLEEKKLDKSYSADVAAIDALLAAAARGATQSVRVPVPSTVPQGIPQQHNPPPAPQAQRLQPVYPPIHALSASQQMYQASHQPPQMQQSGAVAGSRTTSSPPKKPYDEVLMTDKTANTTTGPRGPPVAMEQHKTQQIPTDKPAQALAPMSAVPDPSVVASQKGVKSISTSTGEQLTQDEQFRREAAAAIYDQKERGRARPVVIAGIDLSKENVHDANNYDGVIGKIVAALKQRELLKSSATVSPTAPMVSPHESQHIASQQPQTPPSAISAGWNQQQTQLPLAPSFDETYAAAASGYIPTPVTQSPRHITKETLNSPSTPDRFLTTPLYSRSEPAKTAVDYRQEAMKMFQQLIKDKKPVLLAGLKITREDFTSDMNGCISRLALALKAQAEEAVRVKAEESARMHSEDNGQLGNEETGEMTVATASNEGHEFDFLFDDEADNEFGNAFNKEDESKRWHFSPGINEPDGIAHDNAIREDLGAFAGHYHDPRTNINPQFICQDAFDEPLLPDANERSEIDDLDYLDAPEAWYREKDPFAAVSSALYETGHQREEFTEEDMSYFDLDKMTPSNLQDRLCAIKEEREAKEALSDA